MKFRDGNRIELLRNGVEYSLDGTMHNTTHDNTNLPFPFPDALQEFSVATGGKFRYLVFNGRR